MTILYAFSDEVISLFESGYEALTLEKAGLIEIAMSQLSVGRAYYKKGDFPSARKWLNKSIESFRHSGFQNDLVKGLLARAALYRKMNEYDKAMRDLSEIWEIVVFSQIILYEVDYHIEMARLLLDINKTENLSHHIREAERLATQAGYGCHVLKLAELRRHSRKIIPKNSQSFILEKPCEYYEPGMYALRPNKTLNPS